MLRAYNILVPKQITVYILYVPGRCEYLELLLVVNRLLTHTIKIYTLRTHSLVILRDSTGVAHQIVTIVLN